MADQCKRGHTTESALDLAALEEALQVLMEEAARQQRVYHAAQTLHKAVEYMQELLVQIQALEARKAELEA
jgi:aspartate aminotransferase-like enzyme